VRRGIWVTTTVIIVLQPWAGLTARRGRERLAGTVLGGVVAALLAAVLRDRLQMAAAMFPLAVLAVALRPVHYGLFTFFLTPVFVLLAEPAVGDWRLAAVRIGDTMLGGLLAVVASRLLWPKWEHRAIAPVLGDAVEATRAWVRTAAHAALAGNATEPAVAEALARARRRAGLASNAADAAVERLLAEPRGRWRDEEALLALLARVRRVNGAATGLAVGRAARAPSASASAAVDAALAEVTRALHAEQPPDDGVAEALRHAVPRDGLPDGPTRLVRHVAGLHATASRLLRPTP
jgi:uncharacterized membrane protein YccC